MIRNINITPVLNGFTVQIGCQTLAYTNIDKLLVDLGSYLREPEKTEKRILQEEGINAKHTMGSNGETQARGLVAAAHRPETPATGYGIQPIGVDFSAPTPVNG